MGKDLFDEYDIAKKRFKEAAEILGFDIAKVMFEGSPEDLQQTNVTQPAVFLHSVISAEVSEGIVPDAVAGHSLGEFSALVCNGTLSFELGLDLVRVRAEAMQKACELVAGTMAAIVGLEDDIVEGICIETPGVVIAANYNCPGQLVISGAVEAVHEACDKLKKAGARRALVLPVGGAFHSPLMEPAGEELAQAVSQTIFNVPSCPIYQNVNGMPQSNPETIKSQLISQLTSPVRWTTSVQKMVEDGISEFVEVGGTGKVLQSMVKRIYKEAVTSTL
ncbi:UNVERIFIED_CONTAM: hypothetical protein GTU68_028357 [Idotea baltica]|nr:hypothetical protein [Idotea baltica]